LIQQFHALQKQLDFTIARPQWIPGEDIPEVDRLSRSWSRARAAMEWPLHRIMVNTIISCFGVSLDHAIDRFATTSNRVCRRFNSLLPMPEAEAVDAMAQPWSTEAHLQWINPPFG
jgi:hypothetical protein